MRAELLAVRKTDDGLTLASMARCETICTLLGNGDPAVALNLVKHRLLDSDHSRAMQAVMASLGLTSDARTHLGRLEAFGERFGFEQRQARRYSDRGIRELAQLVATNWASSSVPYLDLTVWQTADDRFAVMMTTRLLRVIEMRQPVATLRHGDVASGCELGWVLRHHLQHVTGRISEPLDIELAGPTSLAVVWGGELWPKFTVTAVKGMTRGLRSETVGAKVAIRW